MATPSPIAEFKKLLNACDRGKNPYDHWDAFLELGYRALAKTMARSREEAEKHEAEYMKTVKRMKVEDVRERYPAMLALCQMHCADMDLLGGVAGEIEALNSHMGQFFTPFPVCKLMAKMMVPREEMRKLIAKKGHFSAQEPAAGAGAMILALAQEVRDLGYEPHRHMFVEAVDLSYSAYRMCYIQLSCAGVPALVRNVNTLSPDYCEGNDMDRAYTPAYRVFVEAQSYKGRQRGAPPSA